MNHFHNPPGLDTCCGGREPLTTRMKSPISICSIAVLAYSLAVVSGIVPAQADENVTQFHNHESRDGLYIDSVFTQTVAFLYSLPLIVLKSSANASDVNSAAKIATAVCQYFTRRILPLLRFAWQ
jgi:hypothetical protein